MINLAKAQYRFLPNFLSILAILVISACNGGLVGSGTGPKVESTYQMRSLPSKTSPALPKTIINSEKLRKNLDTREKVSLRGKNINPNQADLSDEASGQTSRATSWSLLNEKITDVLQLNLDAQELMALLDSRFEQLLSICEEMNVQYSVSNCTIEPHRLTAVYTPKIINLIVQQHYTTYGSAFDNLISLETLANRYQKLEGKTIVFDEIIYNAQTPGTYDQYLSASTNNDHFIIKWTNDKRVVEISITGEQHSSILKYQASEPAEKLVVTKRIPAEGYDEIFNASITSTDQLTSDVLIDAQLITSEYGLFTLSRISDTSGFSFNQYIDTQDETDASTEILRFNQEYFETDGMLVALSECSPNTANNQCQAADSFISDPEFATPLSDSPLFFEPMEFPTLLNSAGVSVWSVANMPTDINEFLIVTNDSLSSGTYLDILCVGTQQIPGEPQLHCSAPSAAFEDAAIVQVIEGENKPRVILGAQLVMAN